MRLLIAIQCRPDIRLYIRRIDQGAKSLRWNTINNKEFSYKDGEMSPRASLHISNTYWNSIWFHSSPSHEVAKSNTWTMGAPFLHTHQVLPSSEMSRHNILQQNAKFPRSCRVPVVQIDSTENPRFPIHHRRIFHTIPIWRFKITQCTLSSDLACSCL